MFRHTDAGAMSPDICSSYYPSDKESDDDEISLSRSLDNKQAHVSASAVRHTEGFSPNIGLRKAGYNDEDEPLNARDTITVEELQCLARQVSKVSSFS